MLKDEYPFNPAISLLDRYQREMLTHVHKKESLTTVHKERCTRSLTVAVSVTAKKKGREKTPKSPTRQQLDKLEHLVTTCISLLRCPEPCTARLQQQTFFSQF